MLTWIAENTIIALALAGIVLAVCRYARTRPAVCHLLWVLVLLRLVAPPLPLPLPSFGPEGAVRTHVEGIKTRLADWLPARAPKAGMLEPAVHPDAGLAAGHSSSRPERPVPRATPASDTLESSEDRTRTAVTEPPRPIGTPSASPPPVAARPTDTPVLRGPAAEGPRAAFFTLDRLRFLLLGVWIAGTLIALWLHARRTLLVRRLVRGSREAPATLRSLADSVAARMGMRTPDVRVLPGLQSPFVWGLGRPCLMWPAAAAGVPRNPRAVMAHELAHVRRRDHWIAWLDVAATSLLWWNPLVWFVRNRIRFHSELACDAWALSVYPGDRRAYAETLIDAAESVSGALALGHADVHPSNFETRLRMVMREKLSCRVQPLIAAVALGAAVAFYPTTTSAQDGADITVQDPVLESVIRRERLRREGDAAYESGNFEEAVRVYRKLAALAPEDGKVWHRLGYCLLPVKEYADAAVAFSKQEKLGFEPANAYYNLGCAFALRGDKDKAFAYLEKAARRGFRKTKHYEDDNDLASLRDDERFGAILDLATEIEDLAKAAGELFEGYSWAKAAEAYAKLAKRTPEDGQVWHRLGYSLIVSGRHADSLRAFRTQLDLGYRKSAALYNLACANALQGNTDEAFSRLKKSIDAGFDQHKLLRTDKDIAALRDRPEFEQLRARCLALAKRGAVAEMAHELADWENAARLYAEIVAGDPKDGEAWGRLADVRAELGDHAGARAALHEQLKLGHEVGKGLFRFGCLHARADEPAQAVRCIEYAIDCGFRGEDELKEAARFACLASEGRLKRLRDRIADAKILDGWGAVDWKHLQRKAEAHIEDDPGQGSAWLKLGWALLRQGRYGEAIDAFRRQEDLGHMKGIARYNVACCYAQKGDTDAAFTWLGKAVGAGFDSAEHLAGDPDMDPLRADPRFADYTRKLKDRGRSKRASQEKKEQTSNQKTRSKW